MIALSDEFKKATLFSGDEHSIMFLNIYETIYTLKKENNITTDESIIMYCKANKYYYSGEDKKIYNNILTLVDTYENAMKDFNK